MPFTCVRCHKEIEKGELRFIDHDHVCASCLKPKKKKKHKSYIPPSDKRDYFSRNRGPKKECELGCGAMVRSQEAHSSSKHFCSFCSSIYRDIDGHNESKHHCDTCEENFSDINEHKKEEHTEEAVENE